MNTEEKVNKIIALVEEYGDSEVKLAMYEKQAELSGHPSIILLAENRRAISRLLLFQIRVAIEIDDLGLAIENIKENLTNKSRMN